jgi:hypothetical protein
MAAGGSHAVLGREAYALLDGMCCMSQVIMAGTLYIIRSDLPSFAVVVRALCAGAVN